MLIYLKYIRKNVPPFIFRVEVLPKKAVLKINKIYIISSSFWWKKYVLHDFEIECRQFRKRMRSTHLSDSNWRAYSLPVAKMYKFKCTKTDTKHEKALIKRTSQHNIRLWERQCTVSLFSISTSLTLNSRSTVAKKLPKLSFSFAPSKSSPRCERRCLPTLTRRFSRWLPME